MDEPGELLSNGAEGGWIIQKFGGTSVGKFAAQIAEQIVRYVGHRRISISNEAKQTREIKELNWLITISYGRINIHTNKVAIVCSARSTDTKAEGTTNRWVGPKIFYPVK